MNNLKKILTKHNKKIIALMLLIIATFFFFVVAKPGSEITTEQPSFWQFRSVDTMKYSRDVAREKNHDTTFDIVIDRQVKQIAETGASHVAIATPYDEEFIPFLKRWVKTARKYDLKVWYRGNWSGWQEWFDYPKIGREEHLAKTEEFILKHPELFEDGDVFSACPECENGGPGDPRMNGDAAGHKKFLIDEYNSTTRAFKKIRKDVSTQYNSMNGDVARLIMDRETTKALGGVVVVDHYVGTPEELAEDIEEYAEQSGGKVVLGEFGAPIPDIHGNMTEEQQAAWLAETFQLLVKTDALVGLNYWTGVGGSTELWNGDGKPRKAVEELKNAYQPRFTTVTVLNETGDKINASIIMGSKTYHGVKGTILIPYFHLPLTLTVTANGYEPTTTITQQDTATIVLHKDEENVIFKLKKWFTNLF